MHGEVEHNIVSRTHHPIGVSFIRVAFLRNFSRFVTESRDETMEYRESNWWRHGPACAKPERVVTDETPPCNLKGTVRSSLCPIESRDDGFAQSRCRFGREILDLFLSDFMDPIISNQSHLTM
jgi:hypothetical protein